MNTRKHLLVASMTFALAACGGGGSGGDEPTPKDPDTGSTPPPEETIAALCDASYETPSAPEGDIVGGTASSVRDGVVTIQEWNGSNWSNPIDTTTTDSHGRFSFSAIGELTGPVRFELTGNTNTQLRCESATGCGSTEAGEYYPAPENYKLSTVVNGEGLTTVALSPVTNIAAQWAMDMPKGVTSESLGLSSARVQALFALDNDFTTSLPTVIADCDAIRTASSGDQNHAIISAAFADLAEDEGYSHTLMVEGAAYMYSLLGGQVLTGSGDLSISDIEQLLAQYPQYADTAQEIVDLIPFDNLSLAGLDRLMASAGDVVRGLEEGDAFTESQGSDLRSDLNSLVSTWNDRLVTNLVESTDYDPADFATGEALLDVYDGYRQEALVEEDKIDAANRNLGWLYIDDSSTTDTANLVNAVSDSLNWAVQGAICITVRSTGLTRTCSLPLLGYDSPIDGESRVSLPRDTSTLELRGLWENSQDVTLDIGVQDIRNLLQDGEMTIRLNGSIDNGTASTNFDDLLIELDIRDNDLTPFQDLSVADFGDADTLNPLLDDLVADLNIRIGLKGGFDITSADASIGSYTVSGMDSFLDFKRQVITQGQDAPVLAYGSKSSTTNPAGETEGPIGTQHMYELVLDDPLTLQTAYRFESLGLPPMELEAGGDLTGYEDIVSTLTDYITALLENNPDGSTIDYDAVYAELQTLFGGMDFNSLALNGDNSLTIFDDQTLTYSLTTEADGGISITDGAAEPQATLYIRGVAGYVYTNDTLVAVANFGDEAEGLLVNLVDGDQRAYPSVVRDDEEALQAATWTLLESLFGDLFTADPAP